MFGLDADKDQVFKPKGIDQGYIRLGNLRVNAPKKYKPKPGESIIRVDRDNPILGNKHILYDAANEQERSDVLSMYKKDLEFDLLIDGPMSKEIEYIAQRVLGGECIIAMCWCAPLACHAQLIINAVNNLQYRQKRKST